MTNMKEQFRGVVWPREQGLDENDEPIYRYVVVGMLVTNSPIEGLDPNETVIDGVMPRYVREMGMAGALEKAPKFKPAMSIGDANSVLLSLGDIVGKPLKPVSRKIKKVPKD